MIDKLNPRLAGTILIVVPALLILFHIGVLLRLIPDNIVWTGRITSEKTLSIMALVSILINLIIIFCAAGQLRLIKNTKTLSVIEKMLPFVFWWLVGNTIANLFSKSSVEVYVFTPILILLTICFYRIKRFKFSK